MLHIVLEKFHKKRAAVDAWLLEKQQAAGKHPLYASCDLRNSGFKVSVIDTNLFPAGFNNICKGFLRDAQKIIHAYFSMYFPHAKKIGILTEEHTRNAFYQENIRVLTETIHASGFEVRVFESLEIFSAQSHEVDCVIVNNDYSGGLPHVLKNTPIPLLPPPQAGWHQRSKNQHFIHLQKTIEELAHILEIDPWFLFPITTVVDDVAINDSNARERLAYKAHELLKIIEQKYKENGITEKPYLIMKDDAGTYGIGVTAVHDASEILAFNKKRRDTFKFGKNKKPITRILLQEGIPSSERIHGLVSEPVVYVINHRAIGGFFRMHEDADERSSLNRPGMQFTKLCFHEIIEYRNANLPHCNVTDLEALYFTLGAAASFAAAEEIKALISDL